MPATELPNGRVHFVDEGRGEPAVVLLHAFPLAAPMWESQVAALAGRHRVIAPDLRGFGGSDVPGDPGSYSIDAWADDVAALIDGLGLGRVVLGGLSMGGYVAFAMLRRHPGALAGLLLCDTRAGVDTPEIRARREEQQRRLAEAGEPGPVADSLLGPLVAPDSTRREEVLERARQLLDQNRVEGVIGGLEAMKNRSDSTGDLASIAVPTLVVVGEHDQPSPPGVAQEMAEAIPGSMLQVVPEAGHLTNMENPEVFNQALDEFLGQF